MRDRRAPAEIARFPHDDDVGRVAFSPDEQHVVTASDDRTARVWSLASGREVARVFHDDTVTGLAFTGVGRLLATAAGDPGAALVLAARGPARRRRGAVGPGLTPAEWSQYVPGEAYRPRFVGLGSDEPSCI